MTRRDPFALAWCPGTGAERSYDKPARAAGLPVVWCGSRRYHAPHSYAFRNPPPPGEASEVKS